MAKKKKEIKDMKMKVHGKDCGCRHCGGYRYKSGKGCFYFLGFIGAAIYYLQAATGFWNGVLGILKALVWPVFIVLKILGL